MTQTKYTCQLFEPSPTSIPRQIVARQHSRKAASVHQAPMRAFCKPSKTCSFSSVPAARWFIWWQ